MKATLLQIKQAIETGALVNLASEPLPIKQAYWIGRTLDAATSEYNLLEKQRIALVKKYGQQVLPHEEERWEVASDKLGEFQAEFAELLKEEVDITGRGFTLEDLKDVKLSGIHLLNLSFLISEDEANSKE